MFTPKLTKETRFKLKWLGIYYAALLVWLGTTALHVPDGYMSPETSIILFLLVLPFWVIGLRKVRQNMSARSVPLIALMAAFSYVIMMFNIPLPGGTTGHAVGATLAAIILGPEIAVIAVSIALIIQAVFFGDGGILAIGANCFNIGVVVPYVAYGVYRAFAKDTPITSKRRVIGAAVAGWVGLNAAAFITSVQFGLQPLLFTGADGAPLYAPYPLAVAIPAVMIPHILVASVVEGVLTALVIAYLQRSNVAVLETAEKPAMAAEAGGITKLRGLWVGMAVLIVASPLGLLAPGTAWGEWGTEELTEMGLPAIPAGLERLSTLWGAPIADYDLPMLGNANLGYIISAIVGIAITALVVWLFTMLLTRGVSSQKQNT
jgi:cobalt/nickel transport system permease protein